MSSSPPRKGTRMLNPPDASVAVWQLKAITNCCRGFRLMMWVERFRFRSCGDSGGGGGSGEGRGRGGEYGGGVG